MRPITLTANQPRDRFYAGGERIAAFRGTTNSHPNTPEDWIASVTAVRGEPQSGQTRLPDGTMLADAIAAEPLSWLGVEHVNRFGEDPALLVKLLDAGQRLPIHAHPDDAFAAAHVGTAHGKAEAWYILTAGTVYLGLREAVSKAALLDLVGAQKTDVLLDRMHTIEVQPGDTVFVPPGTLHAIGEGILLVEVQQPEDLSILLEWRGFDLDGENDGHLGIGFGLALDAVECRERSTEEIERLVMRGTLPGPALVETAQEWFRLDLLEGSTDLPPGYGVLVVIEGSITLQGESYEIPASAGTTILLPEDAAPLRIVGPGRSLLCRPPAP